MKRGWLPRLVLASSLSLVLTGLLPTTWIRTPLTSWWVADAVASTGEVGSVERPPAGVDDGTNLTELGLPRIVDIGAGASHYCLVGDDGSVWCWGANNYGQLGIGSTARDWVPMPQRVQGIPGRVRQVVAFDVSTCALTDGGGAWCWGWNEYGELGDGTTQNRFAPTQVLGLESGVASLGQSHTESHMCAVRADLSALCWGENYGGQLGDGTTDVRVGPVPVSVTSEKLTAIVTTQGSTCALTTEGAVRCWGQLWEDSTGKTEEGSARENAAVTPLGLGDGVASLAASGDSVCALVEGGAVRCWSWGWDIPAYAASSSWNPGPVPETVADLPEGMETVQLIRYNWAETQGAELRASIWACATRDDRAWCWGDNRDGQLGDGSMTDRSRPVEVQTGNIARLELGHISSLALLRDGSLLMWGSGSPVPRSPFAAPATPTGRYREPDTLVPAITTHIPTPADISTDPPVVGANLLLAALAMIAFTVATELLNRSLGQVEPGLARRLPWIGRLDRARSRLDTALIGRFGGRTHVRRANLLRILGIALFYGVVFALLDPTWNPLTITGLWLVVIMGVAFGVVGLSGDISAWAMARRWGVASELGVKPGSLVAAVASTLFSRVFVVVPGVMIGSPEALDIGGDRVDRRRLGRIAGVGLGTVIAVGSIAWLATLATTALRGNGAALDVALGGVEAFLLLVFAAAVQNGFVQLLSLRESAGLALRRTHRLAWLVALLGVTFAFWHTLVNPRGDLAEALGTTNVQAFMVTVGIVLAIALVMWATTFAARRRTFVPSTGAVVADLPLLSGDAVAAPAETPPLLATAPIETGPLLGGSLDPSAPAAATLTLEPSAPTIADAPAMPAVAPNLAVSSAPSAAPSVPLIPRFCIACGTPRGDAARFCRMCGLDLLGTQPQPAAGAIQSPWTTFAAGTAPVASAPAASPMGRRALRAVVVTLILSILVIAGVATVVVLQEQDAFNGGGPDMELINSRAAICAAANEGEIAYGDYANDSNAQTVEELALQQISREYNATRMSVDAQLLAESLSDAPSNLEPDLRAEAAWIAGLPPLDVKDATATNMLGEAFGRLDGLCEQYR